MSITILLFGILRDVVGESKLDRAVNLNTTLEILRKELAMEFPKLNNYKNYSIAVNEVYAESDCIIKENDVVALIPPVSGG
jgi:molybdopterin converting factor small subunit